MAYAECSERKFKRNVLISHEGGFQQRKEQGLVRRFFAAIEHGDFRVFDEIVAEDYNDHLAGQTPGRETLKRYFTGLRSAFADLKLPITNIVA